MSSWDQHLREVREEMERELERQVEAGFAAAAERGLNISREDVRAILLAADEEGTTHD